MDLVGHLRRFWAAPGKDLLWSSSPAPTFGVQPHVSPLLLPEAHGDSGRRRLQEGCLPISPWGCSPGQRTLLLISWEKAWLPGQCHPPHLGTKELSFPEQEWEGVPRPLTTDDLRLPWGLLADSLSLSDSSPSLSSRSFLSLFLFTNLPCVLLPLFPFSVTSWSSVWRGENHGIMDL